MLSNEVQLGQWYTIRAHWGVSTRIVRPTRCGKDGWHADTQDGRTTWVYAWESEWMEPASETDQDAPTLRPTVLRSPYAVERYLNENGDDGGAMLTPTMRDIYGEI